VTAGVLPMNVDAFLAEFAAELGVPAPSAAEAEALLRIASIAAHASERMAAPLACWMVGASGRPIAELLTAVQSGHSS
jgi:hypothetical protein